MITSLCFVVVTVTGSYLNWSVFVNYFPFVEVHIEWLNVIYLDFWKLSCLFTFVILCFMYLCVPSPNTCMEFKSLAKTEWFPRVFCSDRTFVPTSILKQLFPLLLPTVYTMFGVLIIINLQTKLINTSIFIQKISVHSNVMLHMVSLVYICTCMCKTKQINKQY